MALKKKILIYEALFSKSFQVSTITTNGLKRIYSEQKISGVSRQLFCLHKLVRFDLPWLYKFILMREIQRRKKRNVNFWTTGK